MWCEYAKFVAPYAALLGSILLVFPAYRASSIMMRAFSFEKANREMPSSFGAAVDLAVTAYKAKAGEWTPRWHFLLIAGVILMIVGGFAGILNTHCNT